MQGVSKPCGMLNGMRIWESRKSEGLSVIERIRNETSSYPATAGGRLLRSLSLQETVRKLITPLVSVLQGKFKKQIEFCIDYKICV